MGPRRRASIALLAVLGLCGLGLSVTYTDPPSTSARRTNFTVTRDPLPTPKSRNEELKTSLDTLDQLVTNVTTLANESEGSLHNPNALADAQKDAERAKEFFTSTNAVNELGLTAQEAQPFQADTDQLVKLLEWHEQNIKYLVALWQKGQQITGQLMPIYENGEGAVAVWDLKSDQPIVQWNADTLWTPGSTYKVFTAYSILNAIDRGEISSDNVAGWNLDSCFYDMILVSDNNCAEAWLVTYGFDRVEADAHAIGATSTFFEPGDLKTTANDLSHFMEKLYDGTILSDSSREYLINDLFTHMHRYGIPQVMPETDRVFNKVGFVFGYMNDTAIVYTPHGDYAITIMTNYLDWEQIRQGAVVIREALDTPLSVEAPGPKPEIDSDENIQASEQPQSAENLQPIDNPQPTDSPQSADAPSGAPGPTEIEAHAETETDISAADSEPWPSDPEAPVTDE